MVTRRGSQVDKGLTSGPDLGDNNAGFGPFLNMKIIEKSSMFERSSQSQPALPTSLQILALVVLCLVAIAGRLLIETPNFQPLIATAIVAGAIVGHWRSAILVPLTAMGMTDIWLGAYEWPLMVAVYGCLLLPAFWAPFCRRFLGSHPLVKWVGWNVGGVLAAVLFFVVTNLVCWAATPWYPKTWAGLQHCYWAALPFFRWMLLGNLCFVSVLGGIWLMLESALVTETRPETVSC